MKNRFIKILNSGIIKKTTKTTSTRPESTAGIFVIHNSERKQKIEKGAKDFAVRFEGVMKELSNG